MNHVICKTKQGQILGWGDNRQKQLSLLSPIIDRPKPLTEGKAWSGRVLQCVAGARGSYLLVDGVGIVAVGGDRK